MALPAFSDNVLTADESWISDENVVRDEDQAVHRWYRFVLAYPPHLVRDYLNDFEVGPGGVVLDPFCGTGTTIVEAKKLGVTGIGIEAAPMAHFACAVKTNWTEQPNRLMKHARCIAASLANRRMPSRLRTLSPEAASLLIKDSISPRPLHRALVLSEAIRESGSGRLQRYEMLALARILPTQVGNLRFGPEIGVSAQKKDDAPVVDLWLAAVEEIASDLAGLPNHFAPSKVIHGDSRRDLGLIEPGSVDAIITSPPYPNEKDYTRTTRLESVLLGFFSTKAELRASKKTLVRSNTRTIYKGDDDESWVADHVEIQRLAKEIEDRRIEMGKTSGFEKQYHKVTTQYFGGMARHLDQMKTVLRPGAQLAYVVGDQASYLRVMIRTGELLADIAERQGFEVERIDLFRTRPATATKELLREEVVVLRWPGV